MSCPPPTIGAPIYTLKYNFIYPDRQSTIIDGSGYCPPVVTNGILTKQPVVSPSPPPLTPVAPSPMPLPVEGAGSYSDDDQTPLDKVVTVTAAVALIGAILGVIRRRRSNRHR